MINVLYNKRGSGTICFRACISISNSNMYTPLFFTIFRA